MPSPGGELARLIVAQLFLDQADRVVACAEDGVRTARQSCKLKRRLHPVDGHRVAPETYRKTSISR